MRTILIIIRKEFIQIFRKKQMLPIIFVLPVVQLLILVNAATFELKEVRTYVVDDDYSAASRRLAGCFVSSGYFKLSGSGNSPAAAEQSMARGDTRLIVRIPRGFERAVARGEKAGLQLLVSADDAGAAGLISAYSAGVISAFGSELNPAYALLKAGAPAPGINFSEQYLYNPELDYKLYMAPGLLVVLITIIGLFLSSMNIVREKEEGTIEQLNVTPIKKYQFITGKLLPFLLIGLFELAFGLLIIRIIFHVPILGNLFLLFGLVTLYLFVALAAGLLISTVTETQQQAMFIAWFFVVIFMLLSGLFTPIEGMPAWARVITKFNPLAHLVEIMRRVLLKGAGFSDVAEQFKALLAMAVALMALSVWRYRKSTD